MSMGPIGDDGTQHWMTSPCVVVVVGAWVVVLAAGAVVVVDVVGIVVFGGQGLGEQLPGPTLRGWFASHAVSATHSPTNAPPADPQHCFCTSVVVVVVEVVVVETGTPAGVEASDPHGSAAHEPFDVVPTQTLPPRGARHAAARRKAWQCVTPLASVRQHRTALGRPQVERAAQARSCALHSSESVPLLTAARAAPATQRT